MVTVLYYLITYLLVDAEDPALDIGIVIVRDVIDSKYGAVLDGAPTVGPERWVTLDLAIERNP